MAHGIYKHKLKEQLFLHGWQFHNKCTVRYFTHDTRIDSKILTVASRAGAPKPFSGLDQISKFSTDQ